MTKETRKDNWFSLIILAAAFLTQMINFSFSVCFGIYFVTLLDYFKATKRQVTVIGSICYGMTCGSSILASILYRKFGCRAVVMSGGLIASIGCFLSYFATSLYHLYITYGVMIGLGMGLTYTPTMGIMPDYFEKYRFFATAFVTVGCGLGSFVFQPIYLGLIKAYSWQGSMLINSGLALQVVLFGSLMKSRSVQKNLDWRSLLETQLFRQAKFCLLLFACVLWGGGVYTVFSLSNSLVISNGLSKEQSTYVAAMIGLLNIIGGICSSLIGQCKCVNRSLLFCTWTVVLSVGALCASLSNSFVTFSISFMIFGLGYGFSFAQLPGLIMEYFGVEGLVNGLGYTVFGIGLGSMTIPPLAGYIADLLTERHAYTLAFLCGIISAFLAYFTTYLNYKQKQAELTEQS